MNIDIFSIKNFRATKENVVEAHGKNVEVKGANGLGKTTFFDAYTWLLFGKNSAGATQFDLKFHDKNMVEIIGKGLEPTVEITFNLDDGSQITLKKVYAEKWVKPQGKSTKVFQGNEVKYYINGLEVKATQYKSQVDSLIQEEVFKRITNPRYLTEQVKWQTMRETLLVFAPDINVESPAELTLAKGRFSYDEFDRFSKQHIKELDKERGDISAKLEVLGPSAEIETDIPSLKSKIGDLEVKKSMLQTDYRNISMNDPKAKAAETLRQSESGLENARSRYSNDISARESAFSFKENQLQNAVHNAEQRISSLTDQVDMYNGLIKPRREERNNLLDEHKSISESNELLCPSCGQAVPAEMLEQIRADKLSEIVSKGTAIAAEISRFESKLNEVKRQLESEKDKGESATRDLILLRNEHEKSAQIKFEDTPEYKAMSEQIEKLRAEYEAIPEDDKQKKLDDIQQKINGIDSELQGLISEKSKQEEVEKAKAEISRLLAREKEVNADIEKNERYVSLSTAYRRAKSKAIQEAVNSKFEAVKFKLFDYHDNGEEFECCEAVFAENGTTYSNASNGQKTIIGVEICNAFMQYYGVVAPLFIDNSESITIPINTQAQTFSLVVSKDDTTLKIKVEE